MTVLLILLEYSVPQIV